MYVSISVRQLGRFLKAALRALLPTPALFRLEQRQPLSFCQEFSCTRMERPRIFLHATSQHAETVGSVACKYCMHGSSYYTVNPLRNWVGPIGPAIF